LISFFLALYASEHTRIYANDSAIWIVGRTKPSQDGVGVNFDWESTQFYINVENATYVQLHMQANGNCIGRFITYVDYWEASSVWIGNGQTVSETVTIANGLHKPKVQIRVITVLEPAFMGISDSSNAFMTFAGFSTDGKAVAPGPFRKRRIEMVGDSISAGYGSRGFNGAGDLCVVAPYTSGNPYTYNWEAAEVLGADLVPIAWSGKGMYQNCCDDGPKMPDYYLQTLGGGQFPKDWNFHNFQPDMMIINLGTNDFGHYAGPAWAAKFEAAFEEFMINVTKIYKKPQYPFFIAQGPMDCTPRLNASLQNVITKTAKKGLNPTYMNLCGPPNDGCGGHPGVLGHLQMAQLAVPIIKGKMGWN